MIRSIGRIRLFPSMGRKTAASVGQQSRTLTEVIHGKGKTRTAKTCPACERGDHNKCGASRCACAQTAAREGRVHE